MYSIIDTKLDVQIVIDQVGRLLGYLWPEPDGCGGEYWVAQGLTGDCSRWDESWQDQPFRSPEEAALWVARRSPWQVQEAA